MFVNFTNHNSSAWSKPQTEAAEKYGSIQDHPFPNVDPHWDEEELDRAAAEAAEEIAALNPQAVLCQGEMSLAFRVVTLLKEKGIKVLCATSERKTDTSTDSSGATVKKVCFEFIRFREF